MQKMEASKVHIGEVVRNAVVFDLKSSADEVLNADSLPEAVERLFTMLDEREIDYLLVGGIAMLSYVEGRNTEDIDIIVEARDLARMPEISIESRDADFARGKLDRLRIDTLLTENPLFEEVRRNHAAKVQFADRSVPCATVEGLLLLKLYALPSLYRQGNFARVGLYENDVATLIQSYEPSLEPLLDELSGHLSATDMTSIRAITSEIIERIERFKRGNAGNAGDG